MAWTLRLYPNWINSSALRPLLPSLFFRLGDQAVSLSPKALLGAPRDWLAYQRLVRSLSGSLPCEDILRTWLAYWEMISSQPLMVISMRWRAVPSSDWTMNDSIRCSPAGNAWIRGCVLSRIYTQDPLAVICREPIFASAIPGQSRTEVEKWSWSKSWSVIASWPFAVRVFVLVENSGKAGNTVEGPVVETVPLSSWIVSVEL